MGQPVENVLLLDCSCGQQPTRRHLQIITVGINCKCVFHARTYLFWHGIIRIDKILPEIQQDMWLLKIIIMSKSVYSSLNHMSAQMYLLHNGICRIKSHWIWMCLWKTRNKLDYIILKFLLSNNTNHNLFATLCLSLNTLNILWSKPCTLDDIVNDTYNKNLISSKKRIVWTYIFYFNIQDTKCCNLKTQ